MACKQCRAPVLENIVNYAISRVKPENYTDLSVARTDGGTNAALLFEQDSVRANYATRDMHERKRRSIFKPPLEA